MGNAANMVHMPVGNDYAFNLVGFIFQIINIGNDIIDARHIFLGKLQAHVDQDYLLVEFDQGHITADLFQSAQC